jgi:hypothetical protein
MFQASKGENFAMFLFKIHPFKKIPHLFTFLGKLGRTAKNVLIWKRELDASPVRSR